MTNYRKQLTAKAAWGKMAAENRAMRDSLEQIAEVASKAGSQASADVALKKIRHLASTALSSNQKKAA